MRFDKEYWSVIGAFAKSFVFSFLLFYFAFDVWRLVTGDMRPLRKKGILVEWLVNRSDDQSYTAVRVTYTYHEPLLSIRKPTNNTYE